MTLLYNNIEKISFTIFIFASMLLLSISLDDIDAQSKKKSKKDINPVLTDPNLKAQLIIDKLKFPIGMEIIGNDDFLLIEKNTGIVKRIANGQVTQLLDLNVASESERGLLGIAYLNLSNSGKFSEDDDSLIPSYVFLFATETESQDDGNILGNKLYRYDFIDGKLVNPVLLLDLPFTPGPSHNGGVLRIGPDGNLYLVMGDLNRNKVPTGDTIAQNLEGTSLPDGRGGVLRITPDGDTVNDGFSLGNSGLLDKYYGYGIRNSFGIGFDSITGYLWDTENGSHYGDEINIIKPGFNSGWRQVLATPSLYKSMTGEDFDRNMLITFNNKGKYYDPALTWNQTMAPTTIAFIHTDTLGDEYKDDMLVGGVKNGTLLHFDLNSTRTGLQLTGPLADRIVNTPSEINEAVLGTGFGIITDIKIDPTDGDLFVIASNTKNGKIFKISKS
jgi:glucose/arabinose dehydrogenase